MELCWIFGCRQTCASYCKIPPHGQTSNWPRFNWGALLASRRRNGYETTGSERHDHREARTMVGSDLPRVHSQSDCTFIERIIPENVHWHGICKCCKFQLSICCYGLQHDMWTTKGALQSFFSLQLTCFRTLLTLIIILFFHVADSTRLQHDKIDDFTSRWWATFTQVPKNRREMIVMQVSSRGINLDLIWQDW